MKLAIGYFVALLLMLICVAIIWKWHEEKEYFEVYPSMEEHIIALYEEILERQPTATEMIQSSRDITNNTITWEGMRQRLMDTDEYDRKIKLQSNALAPELDKMLAESRLIREIMGIYREVRKKDMPSKMILPLLDIYIAMNYNPFLFAAMLMDAQYETFEEDVLRMNEINKEVILGNYAKTFDQTKLTEQSVQLSQGSGAAAIISATVTNFNPQVSSTRSPAAASSAVPNAATTTTSAAAPASSSIAEQLSPQEQEALREVLRVLGVSPDGSGANADSLVAQQIQQNANLVFDINGAARRIEQTHEGDMVLRPEFAWSVPQRRAPVCTTLGRASPIQPVMTDSRLLLGTSLADSQDTQVGSIMPKFEYKQYVDVPLKPGCPAPSSDA